MPVNWTKPPGTVFAPGQDISTHDAAQLHVDAEAAARIIEDASDAIVVNADGAAFLALDAGGHPTAVEFRETAGTGLPASEVGIVREAGGSASLKSSARGLLTRLAPETLDEAGLRRRFDGPWKVLDTRYEDGVLVADIDWLDARCAVSLNRQGVLSAHGAKRIYVWLAVGQSDQGNGSTGSWVAGGLAPHAAFLLDNEYSNKLGAMTTGFGNAETSTHGAFTAFGLVPFRNVSGQQSLVDAAAARFAHLQCKSAGTCDWHVTINVSASGASIEQIGPNPPSGETVWDNTILAIQEAARLGDIMGLPVEVLAVDFRQGYADREDDDTQAYLTKLAAYEQALADAIATAFPGQSYRPWFVVQQVVDAIRSAPNDDAEGPALAHMQFARENTQGNVLYVPSTVHEQHEVANIHATEWAYVANGEHAARGVWAAHFGGPAVSSPWPVADTGVLTGTEFRYQMSSASELTVERPNIAGAFEVTSANTVSVTDARLEYLGMEGPRHIYDVVLTLSGDPGVLDDITHAKPDETEYLSATGAIRSREPLSLLFASQAFDRNRLGNYDTHIPGDENIPVPLRIWGWAGLHKIGAT